MSSSSPDLLCPSSHAGIEGARVLGVFDRTDGAAQVSYLDEPLLASEEVLALAAPASPSEVFRVAAKCQTAQCPHFDGANCGLATRIVQILPAVVSELPRCHIRHECRWFQQEGAAACRRCPQIATINYNPSQTLQQVVGLASLL